MLSLPRWDVFTQMNDLLYAMLTKLRLTPVIKPPYLVHTVMVDSQQLLNMGNFYQVDGKYLLQSMQLALKSIEMEGIARAQYEVTEQPMVFLVLIQKGKMR